MGRSYSSGVSIDKPNFSPDVAVRVAPVPQDDAARSRSSSAHVHVSSQVDAHLAFGVLVRRAASALARCYCVGVAILLASAAATSAALSADSAWALLCFRPCYGSASGVGTRIAAQSFRSCRSGLALRVAFAVWRVFGLCFASVVQRLCLAWSKPSLQRLQHLSLKLGHGLEDFQRRPKISRVFYLGLWLCLPSPAESVITRGLQFYKQK